MAGREDTFYALSLDGGGLRGYFEICLLQLIMNRMSLSDVSATFDLISGTSTGGIQALAYANGKTPAEMKTFFEDKADSIFKTNSLTERVEGSSAYKGQVMISANSGAQNYVGEPGNGNWCFYWATGLENAANEVYGDDTLADLGTYALVTTWNSNTNQPVIITNVSHNPDDPLYVSDLTIKLKDAARATSAAPLYFPFKEFAGPAYTDPRIVGKLLDGGIYCNNPSLIAYNLAKKIKPKAKRICLLSLGTGNTDDNFYPTLTPETSVPPYNVRFISYLLDSVFLSGPSYLVDNNLTSYSNNPYNNFYYCGLNFSFTVEEQNTPDGFDGGAYSGLDGLWTWKSSNPLSSDYYVKDFSAFYTWHQNKAQSIFDANLEKIDNFIEHFLVP